MNTIKQVTYNNQYTDRNVTGSWSWRNQNYELSGNIHVEMALKNNDTMEEYLCQEW
jgi:hypothetical protein